MNAGRRTPPIVSRDYRPGPDHCARALELLLRKPTIKKGAEPRKPGVSNDADLAEIRAAHRRLIARVHPDAGGSEELASRINAARDALIADLTRSAARRRDPLR